MLIEFKVNFKLSVILRFIVFRGWFEEFHDVIFGEQGTAQDAHDLHDWTSEVEVVLDDADETVCDDGNMNLYPHRIVAISPERLDSEMLLNPLEEQLDLPSVSVKEGDVLGREMEVVGVVSERPSKFGGIVNDAPDSAGILCAVSLLREDDGLVSKHIVRPLHKVLSVNDLIGGMLLLSYDEEGSGYGNPVQSGKVKVTSVKDIARERLVCEPVHGIDVMDVGVGDSVEHGNLRDDVHLRMDFDARLRASELRLT